MKQDFVTLWKKLADLKCNGAISHLQLCVLRAMASKSDDKVEIARHLIRKAFSPVTKSSKLVNGRVPFDTVQTIIRQIQRWPKILGEPIADVLTDEEQVQYKNILSALQDRSKLVRRYSYFFTRQDVFEEYQLVQTAHAALELGARLTTDQVKDLHFTCCGVPNLEELEAVERVLDSMKIEYVVFREPDIGNQKTAIGVFPIEEQKRGLLRNYNLLRFNRSVPQSEGAESAILEELA
jgi:hypothetical protein